VARRCGQKSPKFLIQIPLCGWILIQILYFLVVNKTDQTPPQNRSFAWNSTWWGTMGTMWGIRAATTWFSTWRARNLPPQAGGDPSDRKWICSILGAPKRQALQREHLFRNWYFGTAPNFCTLRWLVSNAERWYHLWRFGWLEMSVVCQNRRRTDLHVRLLVPE
jgi:hypothetical protein